MLKESGGVLLKLGRTLTIAALILSIGAHWALLQSVAWAGMLYSYSQQTSFTRAVEMTFDGDHPCSLCAAIEEGKAQEKQQREDTGVAPATDLKLDLPPGNLVLSHPPHPPVLPAVLLTPCNMGTAPELPPPRRG